MFPTPHTVGHHAYSPGGADPFLEPPSWTPARDQPGAQVAVHSWHVPTTTEPKLAGHDRVIVDIELLAPISFQPGPHDLIDLPSGQYEVIGVVQDYTTGPWRNPVAGGVINLRKVDG